MSVIKDTQSCLNNISATLPGEMSGFEQHLQQRTLTPFFSFFAVGFSGLDESGCVQSRISICGRFCSVADSARNSSELRTGLSLSTIIIGYSSFSTKLDDVLN